MDSLYRKALPQLEGGFFLTDGGIETSLIFNDGLELPERSVLPNLNVMGGCCGTDYRHVEQIASACAPIFHHAA